MATLHMIENETKLEPNLTGDWVHAKRIHLEDGLMMEQRLSCANHADEEIILDRIGWKNFICPKCGRDYSIGRKIVLLK